MEVVSLISALKYPEKQVGYIVTSSLLNENHDFLRLAINTIRNDIIGRNETFQCLALTMVPWLSELVYKKGHLKVEKQRILLTNNNIIKQRWTALPGEPPVIDDCEVDDWLPHYVVLQGECLFFYLSSIDLGSQDTTLLSDIVELGSLPDIEREVED